MKSSTIRRSTLSKQSIDVIEALAKENQDEDFCEYVREDDVISSQEVDNINKSQEIDLLWQNFKSTQFTTNSPTAYILMGFGIGVLTTVLCFGLIYFAASKSETSLFNRLKSNKAVEVQTLEEQSGIAGEEVSGKVVVPSEEDKVQPEQAEPQANTEAPAVSELDKSKMKKYVVKNGDTVESIIIKNYGSYSPERAEMIMKANDLKTLDRINIDQELLLPAQ